MTVSISGSYTALVTAFKPDYGMDWSGLRALVEFQRDQGITGIVPAGTTGESPTLNWEDHYRVIETVFETGGGRIYTITGTGAKKTKDACGGKKHGERKGNHSP